MDAGYELLQAMIAHLRADAAVTALVGNRIYDRVPQKQNRTPDVPYPFVDLGPTTATDDGWDCRDSEEITVQFDVWTSGTATAFGSAECRQITGAIKRALHRADLTLPVNGLVSIEHELTRILDDPNPAIKHGVVQFTAQVELHD